MSKEMSTCTLCNDKLYSHRMEYHMSEKCRYSKVDCPYGCGVTIYYLNVKYHTNKICSIAWTRCEDCNEKTHGKS